MHQAAERQAAEEKATAADEVVARIPAVTAQSLAEESAATKIQAIHRGRLSRRQVHPAAPEEHKDESYPPAAACSALAAWIIGRAIKALPPEEKAQLAGDQPPK